MQHNNYWFIIPLLSDDTDIKMIFMRSKIKLYSSNLLLVVLHMASAFPLAHQYRALLAWDT
jgi:hypothetical protein